MKYIMRILFPVVLGLIMMGIYYIFFSYEQYKKVARILPPAMIWIVAIIGIIVIFIIRRFVLKTNLIGYIAMCSILIIVYIGGYYVIDSRYSTVVGHYYAIGKGENLLNMHSYMEETGSYTILIKSLNEGTLSINNLNPYISAGDSSDELVEGKDSPRYRIYLINHANYIVYDWEKEDIVSVMSTVTVDERISKLLGEGFTFQSRQAIYTSVLTNSGSSIDFTILLSDSMTIKVVDNRK